MSLCSPDGHVIGGGVGGVLTAGSPVQVFPTVVTPSFTVPSVCLFLFFQQNARRMEITAGGGM